MTILRIGRSVILLSLLMLIGALLSNASEECSLCKNAENWSSTASDFLSGTTTEQNLPSTATPQLARAGISGSNANGLLNDGSAEQSASVTGQQSRTNDVNSNYATVQRKNNFQEMLVTISSITAAKTSTMRGNPSGYDVILDVSPEANEYIKGAISIPYAKFIENGAIKPVSELAKVLGDAGISEHDSVLLYGQCLPCGVNAAYVYWVMKYLGHDKVKVLDGGIDDWVAAKLPTATKPNTLPKTNYTPRLDPGLWATYDYVKNGKVQIVDARPFQEFGSGYIPKALNIPYDQVMDNVRFKSQADLADLFYSLDKAKPVVVYSDTGTQAGSVWFALEALGYNASLYSWKDWLENLPGINMVIEDIRADPNPATTGSPVKITAIFGEAKKTAGVSSAVADKDENKTILTTKGCATCGFGSPQGFANINKSSGIAQLGDTGTYTPSQTSSFTCTATVEDSSGSIVGRASMKQVAGGQYSGIWNANVEEGIYSVSITVSASGITKTFDNVLKITIAGAEKDTSKYKKIGN